LGEREIYRRVVVLAISVLTVAALLSGFAWSLLLELDLVHTRVAAPNDNSWWGVAWVGFPIVGGAILVHRRANTVGRLLLFTGACMAAVVVTDGILLRPAPRGPVWLEMPGMIAGFLGWIGLIGVVAAFPSGFGASRGARILSWSLGGLAVWISLMGLVSATMVNSGRPNPLSVDALGGTSRWFVEGPGFIIVPTLVIATLVSQALRWRRSRGVVRMQYRWFIAGVTFSMLALGLAVLLAPSGDQTGAIEFGLVNLLWALPMNAVAVSIGVAVGRYRLYELDRVVSRTVSYAVVSLTLVAVYVGVVTVASGLLPGSSDGLVVAVATLVAAALFRPVLSRVQGTVDRRFNRPRYDGQMAVEQFADGLRHQVQPAVVADELRAVLERTVQPRSSALWMREPLT
jgi:hypothetical protein